MLILSILGISITECNERIKNKYIKCTIICLMMLVMGLTVIGRLLEGVHLFTDIICGVILANCIIFLYNALFCKIKLIK